MASPSSAADESTHTGLPADVLSTPRFAIAPSRPFGVAEQPTIQEQIAPMALADRLTQASLVLAHLPADQAVDVLQRLAPSQRRAVRRKLESFTAEDLDQSSEALDEFVAAYHRIDAADSHLGRPHHVATSDLPATARPQPTSAAAAPPTVDPTGPKPLRNRAAGFEFLETLSSEQFLSVMRDEQPATIAAVISQLSPAAQDRFGSAMPDAIRPQIAQQIGIDRPHLPILELLSSIVRRRVSGFGDPHMSADRLPPGVERVDLERDIASERPSAKAPFSGARRDIVRRQDPGVEGFNSLAHLPAAQIRRFLNLAPWDELSVAMIGAAPSVRERLLEQMLPAERSQLRENMRLLGPVRQERTDRQRARLARLIPP